MSTVTATLEELPHTLLRAEEKDTLLEVRPRRSAVPESTHANQTPRLRRRWPKVALAVLLTAAIGTAIGAYVHYTAKFENTDNAFVEANVHPVSSRVTGNVLEVLVDDNEVVEKGQPLVRLDARDFDVKLQSAKASLTQATAQVMQATASLAQSRAMLLQTEAQITSSEAQLEKARLDFERADRLLRGPSRVISQQDFDSAKAAFDAAKATTSAAVAARDAAAAGVHTAEANLAAATAGRDGASAAVDDATLQLSYTTLVAPESGRIAKKTVETGQHVDPGQALLAVVSADRWIVANFKENQLSEMRASQVVEVKIDAIHGRRFRGHVESFAPGTGAEFALLPPDNATGNFTKIVQRVPVKILLNPDDVRDLGDRIAPGLSAIATVRVKE